MRANTRLQESWIWNRSVQAFVKERIRGYSLNVCAGKSPLGDVKLDLDPQNSDVIKSDMCKLPFPDNTFDTVIEDPPWKIGFYQRMTPFFECVRVCKPGGRIIYNAYWIPTSKYVVLKELHIRQDTEWSNASIISVFEKVQSTLAVDAAPQPSSCSPRPHSTQNAGAGGAWLKSNRFPNPYSKGKKRQS